MTEVMLEPAQARVIGSLIEKSMTTPDHYPMSLNGVTVACNQVSNRDPVVDYTQDFVERTLRALADRGLAKLVHRPGDRVVKYRQALDEELALTPPQAALIAVLLLRGPQTPGELRQRTHRYVEFASVPELETTLERLRLPEEGPPLVERLEREPGQKEHRYRELLTGGAAAAPNAVPEADAVSAGSVVESEPGGDIAVLREEIAQLRDKVDLILRELGLA